MYLSLFSTPISSCSSIPSSNRRQNKWPFFCTTGCGSSALLKHCIVCLRGTILVEGRPKNAIFSWTVQQMEAWTLIYLQVEGFEPLILIMYLTLGTIRNCNSKVTMLLTFRVQRALGTVNNILHFYLFQFSHTYKFQAIVDICFPQLF